MDESSTDPFPVFLDINAPLVDETETEQAQALPIAFKKRQDSQRNQRNNNPGIFDNAHFRNDIIHTRSYHLPENSFPQAPAKPPQIKQPSQPVSHIPRPIF